MASEKRKKKLGRGLADVSHIFLSAAETKSTRDADLPASVWIPDVSCLSITSGEGVCGKTFLAANLAHCLHLSGRRVALISADPDKPDLKELIGAACTERVGFARANADFGHLPAVSIPELFRSEHGKPTDVLRAFEQAASYSSVLITDISPWVEFADKMWQLSDLVIVLCSAGRERMESSYRIIKRVHSVAPDVRIGVVFNLAETLEEGERYLRKIVQVARKFLKVNLRNYGSMVYDEAAVKACEMHMPVVKIEPDSRIAACISSICRLIQMDESAIARRRTEVSREGCGLRRGR